MTEREYVVVEPMRTANVFFVTARTRREAIEKVKRDEYDWVGQDEVMPVRLMTIRDARPVRQRPTEGGAR